MNKVTFEQDSKLTLLDKYTFYNCTNLQSVVLPIGLQTIDEYSFQACKKLQSVLIPYTVISIQNYAFLWCDNLATVTYMGTEQQWQAVSVGTGNTGLDNATIVFAPGV